MGLPTSRGCPNAGARCMRKPGAAFTSTTAPPCSCRPTYVRAYDVHSGHVHPQDLGGQFGQTSIARMNFIGKLEGSPTVGLAAQIDTHPLAPITSFRLDDHGWSSGLGRGPRAIRGADDFSLRHRHADRP
jgi:hypothetical protein